MEIINAKIKKTMLGYEDHGILTIFLDLDYGGAEQGFGGYALDEYSKTKEKRIPQDACGLWIQRILEVVGVEKWEDLPGKYIRVKRESEWNSPILQIGNLLEDKWFDPKAPTI